MNSASNFSACSESLQQLHHCPLASEIHISTSNNNGQVVLIIQDNGPGIPVSEWGNILKPFTQLNRSRSAAGNDLGLALVKAICDQHSAKITLGDAKPGLIVGISFPNNR
ncbi:sensor histidine kinase [Pelagibaculum spongiae]|uniref:histidine kinase n=1 Tax=Pelagibaculum spongiae TaxID=2080658 RepID=A0A2V1GYR9_9GAMM|nr:ATP-binding protein [Pelagibaculum spongiae]PVZ68135.1 hypothetical protein DC094_12585 [Pelagibaculum spongiae]